MYGCYDKVIIGAGFYGLYSALRCGKRGEKILILERDPAAFMRASYINQARVHMGYHYPRSLSTAIKSAHYFSRFCEDFGFCIHKSFEQVYATSSSLSWTNAEEFKRFCSVAEIRCDRVDPEWYFKPDMCDGAFLTTEYTYDAQILKEQLLNQIEKHSNIIILYDHKPDRIERAGSNWRISAQDYQIETPYILNTAYAGVNDVLQTVHGVQVEPFKIKYEKCEIILCTVNDRLKDVGLTVMDGPFFSLMPFGKTGLHSLTSVTFTPHATSYNTVADFSCQKRSGKSCTAGSLYNCNACVAQPVTAWDYMSKLARKYIKEEFDFNYHTSLYSMKPILMASEIDDSRPTVIRKHAGSPTLISVLSGKINTVYDLEEVLDNA